MRVPGGRVIVALLLEYKMFLKYLKLTVHLCAQNDANCEAQSIANDVLVVQFHLRYANKRDVAK